MCSPLARSFVCERRLGVDVPSLSAKKADNGERIPGGKVVERGHELRCIRAAVSWKRLRRVSLTFARHCPSSLGVGRVARVFPHSRETVNWRGRETVGQAVGQVVRRLVCSQCANRYGRHGNRAANRLLTAACSTFPAVLGRAGAEIAERPPR